MPALAGAAGTLAALGVVLALTKPSTIVDFDGSGISIAGSHLVLDARASSAGTRVFDGDAAYVLTVRSSAQMKAAAVAVVNGAPATGVCLLTTNAGGAQESCRFTLGAALTLQSHDVYIAHARVWERTYSDGAHATFAVPSGGAPVPIPLPLDHSGSG